MVHAHKGMQAFGHASAAEPKKQAQNVWKSDPSLAQKYRWDATIHDHNTTSENAGGIYKIEGQYEAWRKTVHIMKERSS